jgi:cell division septal protein FtsQ
MKRGIIFWLTFVLAILLAIYLSVRIVIYSGTVRVGRISATVDGRVPTDTLRENIGLKRGMPYVSGEIQNTAARIGSLPEIDAAATRRMPNGDIKIHVRAVKTIALWSDGENCFPVTDTGRILSKKSVECSGNTFVFSGPIPDAAPKFLADLRKFPNIFGRVTRINWTDGRRWDLHTDRTVVKLPEYMVTDALAKLSQKVREHNMFDRKITVIDLRDDDRMLGIIQ